MVSGSWREDGRTVSLFAAVEGVLRSTAKSWETRGGQQIRDSGSGQYGIDTEKSRFVRPSWGGRIAASGAKCGLGLGSGRERG